MGPTDDAPSAATIPAVSRTVLIMEALVGQRDGLSVKDLSERLGITPGMVSRILATLEQSGLVYQHPLTERFHLTYKLLRMAYTHTNSMELDEVCLPEMRKISDATGQLVQLAVVDGWRMTFALKVEGTNPLRVASMLGQQVPLHASACGKCWLAFLPESLALPRLTAQPLTAFTPNTLTQLPDLLRELQLTRDRGYALEREEWTPGVAALAAPIRTPRLSAPNVVAALVVSFPASQYSDALVEELARLAVPAAATIGSQWPPYLESHLYRKADFSPAVAADQP